MAATSCLFTLLSQERGMWDRGRLEGEQITTVKKKKKKRAKGKVKKKEAKKQKKMMHVELWRSKYTEKKDIKTTTYGNM